MSNLPSVIDMKSLEDRLDEATDIDESIESPDGGEMDLPESVKQSILETNISDALADYISEKAVEMPEIRETKLMYGSGDTGRQSQLYLKPEQGVSKDQMRKIGRDLDMILDAVFPSQYLVGITHGNTVDDEGKPAETDEFSVFLVYRARTASRPSKPAGDSTEVL